MRSIGRIAGDPPGGLPEERRRALGALADCPPGTTFRPLSNLHPPVEVIAGYWSDGRFDNGAYLRRLSEIAGRAVPGTRLRVLADERQGRKGLEFAKVGEHASRVTIRTVHGETQWAQDSMEIGVDGEPPRPVVAPMWAERYGDVAQAVGLPTIDSWWERGGRLEGYPGGVTVVTEAYRFPPGQEPPNVVRVDVGFLRIADVDELFGVVPTGEPAPCNFALLYASPALGLELAERLARENPSAPLEPPFYRPHTAREPAPFGASDCLEGLPRAGTFQGHVAAADTRPLRAREALGCDEFVRANREYERIARQGVETIAAAVSARTGCARPAVVPMPQLFRPAAARDRYGDGDGALALNPNTVNQLVLDRTVVVAEQPNRLFENEVRERLSGIGVRTEFIDAGFYHFNLGTVHCSTNVRRECVVPVPTVGSR